jgi:capsular exopolysaccharide synthesis family protein
MSEEPLLSVAPAEGEALISQVHLKEYFRILWKGRFYVLLFLVLFGAGAFVWSKLQIPIYEAVSTISIDVSPPQLTQSQVYAPTYWFDFNYYLNEQIRVIQSYRLAQQVVAVFANDPTFPYNHSSDPGRAFRYAIRVDRQEDTNILNIKIRGTNGVQVANWVNTLVDEYSKLNILDNLRKSQKILLVINDQLQPLSKKLEDSERSLTQFQSSQDVVLSNTVRNVVTEQIDKLNSEYAQAKVERIDIEAKIKALNELRSGRTGLEAFPEAFNNDALTQLNHQRIQLELSLNNLKKQYKDDHPNVKAVIQQLVDIRERIRREIGTLMMSLDTEYKIKKSREEELYTNIQGLKQETIGFSRASLELSKIRENYEQNKTFYEDLLRRSKEMELSSTVGINRIRTIDPAVPPYGPISPKTRQNTILGILLGLLLGVGFVFVLDYLDSSIKLPADVEKYLSLTVLSVIPSYSPEKIKVLKEFYQSLRTAVIFARREEGSQSILITSSGPGEGKTATSYNLAKILASAGDTVALLDCDFRRPAIHKTFNISNQVGITSYFFGRPFEEIVQPSGIPNLAVFPTGPLPPNPPEFITRKGFSDFVQMLKGRYSWIIIDSPPILSVTDPVLLSTIADMTIMVVRYNELDRRIIRQCIQGLVRGGANLIGALINDVDFERDTAYSYYHYYYYYKGYDEETLLKKGLAKDGRKKKHMIV